MCAIVRATLDRRETRRRNRPPWKDQPSPLLNQSPLLFPRAHAPVDTEVGDPVIPPPRLTTVFSHDASLD